jgi:hypothetical protein
MAGILWITGRRILQADAQIPLTSEGCILLAMLSLPMWQRWRLIRRMAPDERDLWEAIETSPDRERLVSFVPVRVIP